MGVVAVAARTDESKSEIASNSPSPVENSQHGMFAPKRTLLNPKFEGYKLDLVNQEDVVARYPLEYKPTQATVSGRSTFSFQEVQSRITHNHLAVWSEAGRAIYVDSDARVIAIDIDAVSFRNVYLGLCFP
jgi:hypothetical protein